MTSVENIYLGFISSRYASVNCFLSEIAKKVSPVFLSNSFGKYSHQGRL